MATAIACPACKRVLNLPAEVLNRTVQCPACRHQFHPAEAAPPENVRLAAPRRDNGQPSSPGPTLSPAPLDVPQSRGRGGPPLPPSSSGDSRRGGRRGKKEAEDICPKCRAFVPLGSNSCAECGAEFEPEDDENYRPWEQDGMERRDSEPHRGTYLMLAGICSLILPTTAFICYVGIVTSILGLVMGACAWVLGIKDMRKIDNHIMDRDGRGTTQAGLWCGAIGAVLNVIGLICAIIMTAMVW